MDQNEDVISVMPVEETLVDPLYEPLKLNRYKLCLHLQRLKDGSHVRHGVSPYLLFDVEWMKKVVDVLNEAVNGKKLSDKFEKSYKNFIDAWKEYLKVNENMRVKDGVPGVSPKNLIDKRVEVLKNYSYTKAKYREILLKTLYKESPFDKSLFEKISHLLQLAHPIRVSCPICINDQFMCEEGKIYSLKEALLRTFELRRAKWLYMSGLLHTIHRAATHTRLSHQIGSMIVGVNALREIDVYPNANLIMSLGEYLLMRGDLHEFLMANFLHDIGHSPLSHVLEPNPFIKLDHEEITRNLILGEKIKSDDAIDWYITERYLLKMKAITEFEHRFFKNKEDPVYKIEDCIEKTKKCLFSWGNVPGVDDGKLRRSLKDDFAIDLGDNAKIDNNPNGNITISEDNEDIAEIIMFSKEKAAILKINDGRSVDLKVKKESGELNVYEGINSSFLNCLKINNEILESEIITVHDVLKNFGVNEKRVVEILTGMVFCPECGENGKKVLVEIKEGWVKCKEPGCTWNKEIGDFEKENPGKIYDTQFLNKLIHSEIDLDRIDHVKRDSVIPGLSLTSFRLTELLGSISLVLPDSRAHDEVYVESSKPDVGIKSPYILISQEGLSYVMDLLNSRREIYNNIMFSDENNWINGVVNQITALAVRYLPHLTNMLPFITDQILAHFFTNDLFIGTQIEKLNLLFHGKNDYSSYGEPMRYKLRDERCITSGNLKEMYKAIEAINNNAAYNKMRLPAVVFYTNITPVECPTCGGKTDQREKDKKKRSWDDMLVYGKGFVKKLPENDAGTPTAEKDPKFHKFNELVMKKQYLDTSRDVFPTKPNELDVKNLFYVWIYDFAMPEDTTDTTDTTDIIERKEKWENNIKAEIGGILAGKNGVGKSFDEWFVPLDAL